MKSDLSCIKTRSYVWLIQSIYLYYINSHQFWGNNMQTNRWMERERYNWHASCALILWTCIFLAGLTYSTLSLLSTVLFLVLATHLNGWKLDKKYGIILMVWYLIFITFASLYEVNVFGNLNPPECPSNY
jgi:hypothetical protein